MMGIDRDRPAVEQRELVIVRQHLRLGGARVLDLDSTICGEGGRVEREGTVGVEVVFAVLEHDDRGGAARVRGVGCVFRDEFLQFWTRG